MLANDSPWGKFKLDLSPKIIIFNEKGITVIIKIIVNLLLMIIIIGFFRTPCLIFKKKKKNTMLVNEPIKSSGGMNFKYYSVFHLNPFLSTLPQFLMQPCPEQTNSYNFFWSLT